ncbi:hypothetical protein NESM_000163800 [Novymonas esmeraldas]|uniref:BRCT domain-containing protein n=1 Tax=Novymonas esmeraldas TaxID=1808958 RepID=A0AAW0F445_9TRYP
MLQLPASYRGLLEGLQRGEDCGAACGRHSRRAGIVAEDTVDGGGETDCFTCGIFVTRSAEFAKLMSVVPFSATRGDPHASRDQRWREGREGLDGGVLGTSFIDAGGRLRVQEGRPDVAGEIRRALTDASTGCVVGDVARKLVLVCGPEGMVADAAAAAAAIGVVVHSEEFLF